MSIDKEDRESYEDGKKEADFISDHPISYLLTGGIHSKPSESSKANAYDKGLKGEQLDGDKGSSSGSDSSGSGGICYLSTACIEYAGLSDNCEELNTLRYFRDNYINRLPDGQSMLSEYYNTAPIILQKIKNSPDYDDILKGIYNTVVEAVTQIKNNNFSKALQCYTEMYVGLKNRLLS